MKVNIKDLKKSIWFTLRLQNILEKYFIDSENMIDLSTLTHAQFTSKKGAGRKSFYLFRRILEYDFGFQYIYEQNSKNDHWIKN